MTEMRHPALRSVRTDADRPAANSLLSLVVTTLVATMSTQVILNGLGLASTLTTALVWLLTGYLVASFEPSWRLTTRSLMIASAIGGLMALTVQTVAAVPPNHHSSLLPLSLLFAETICRSLLCYAAAVGGCLVAAYTSPRQVRPMSYSRLRPDWM